MDVDSSAGVNCVYYRLKESLSVKNPERSLTGSNLHVRLFMKTYIILKIAKNSLLIYFSATKIVSIEISRKLMAHPHEGCN